MRIGIVARRTRTMDGMLEQGLAAERAGLHTLWASNVFDFDALTVAALWAVRTSSIEIGTAVVPMQTRHPYAMAQQAMSVAHVAKSRFTLGIGASHESVVKGMWGLSYRGAASLAKEYIAILRALMRDGRVDHRGEHYDVHAGIDPTPPIEVPILLAALGPRMVNLAGRDADGLLTWLAGPRVIAEEIVPVASEAAAKAGRSSPRIVAGLPVAITADIAGARSRIARSFQSYARLPAYQRALQSEGVDGAADVALIGDEAAVGERIMRLGTIGVTDVLVSLQTLPKDPEDLERSVGALGRIARS